MKKSNTTVTKLRLAFRNLFKRIDKKHKDNYLSFSKAGFTMFLSLTLLALVGFNHKANAQTTLAAGDIAFIAVASDAPDRFAFVTFVDISATTTITFTDNAYSGSALCTNENTAIWTAPAGGITAGSVITITNTSGSISTVVGGGTCSSALNGISASGDQVFAYQGSVFIDGISTVNWLSTCQSCGTSTNATCLPGGLTDGTNAISFTTTTTDIDNGFYSGTTTGTAAALKSAIHNRTNWSTNDNNQTWPSWSFSITNCVAPAITAITSNSPICANGTLNLNVTATGSATLTYEWTGAGSFSSTSVANPTVTNANSGTYSVTVTNSCGSSSSSTSVTVDANVTPSVSIAADAGTTICAGTNVTFTATPTNGGTPVYQWKLNGGNVGTNSNTYSNNALANSDAVTCELTSDATCASPATVTSNTLTMTVNANVTPSVSIAATPGTTICTGTNVTIAATAVNGGATPNYEFFVNTVSVQSGSSNTYSSTAFADNDVITCTLTSNATCQTASTANSNSLTITVTTSVTPSVSIAAAPGNTICSGINVTFTATPTNGGSTPSYQWILNGNNVGTNSDMYTINALANNDVVTCVMTSNNSCASPTTATSNAITMTVTTNVTPAVSIAAAPGNTICAGTSVTFTATPVNGGTPSYQWTKNGNNVGTNSATYTEASLANGDAIICTMTSTENCVTASTAVSNTITMVVNAVPTPTITGTLSFCSGGSTTLDAGAGYASYLWSTNETSQTISVTTAATYTVTVSNGTCTGTSSPVVVTEIAPAAQPDAFTTSSATVTAGQTGVVYTVPNVAGVTYSWSYSGTGATINGSSNSVTVDFSGAATAGDLSVTATNACGTSAARTIAITVATQFTAGRVVVLQMGAGNRVLANTGNPLFLKEFETNGAAGFTVLIDSTGTNALVKSGSATSEGGLTLSSDGAKLIIDGYAVALPNVTSLSGSTAATINRAVGSVNSNGVFTKNFSSTTFFSGNNIRSATSDGTNFWGVGGNEGVNYFGPSTSANIANTKTNLRVVKIFNNQLYASSASASGSPANTGVFQVGTGLPTSGTNSYTSLFNNNNTSTSGFYMNATATICYVATSSGIQKWTLSGTWSLTATLQSTISFFDVIVDFSGANPVLYATTNEATNRLVKITDDGTVNLTALATAPAANNTIVYRGIAFAPVAPVCNAPAITSLTSNSPICASATLNLGVVVTGTAPLTYAWTGAGSFSSTSVANPTVTNATSGTYSVTVTNSCGSSSSSTSVTVDANVTPSVSIAADAGTTICAGTNVTFTATPTNSGTPVYQWKLNGGNVGTNSSTYSNNALVNNDAVTCEVTSDATCALPTTATSNTLTMTVNATITPSVSIAAIPGTTICSGTNVTITATAVNGGATPNYEFFVNAVSVQSGTSNTYSSTSFANSDVITCTLTSNASCQTSSTANSNTLTITVTTSVTPAVSIAALPGNTICSGINVTFTATPTNGGTAPSYQWKLNGSDIGTNSDMYSNNALANNDAVTCVMTSNNSCASPTTATSNAITMVVTTTVTPSVSIVSDAVANTICAGTSVTFTATPINGGTPSYQWTKNGNNVGTNSATYTDALLANGDAIICTMTSTETCVTANTAVSNTITMTVNSLPTPMITGTLTFCTGGSTILDAGAGFASYLWSTTETSQTISVTTAATYTVTVSDGTCTGTSAPVAITEITPAAQPDAFTTSSATVYATQIGVVYIVPNVAGVTYSWSYSGSGATINGSSNSVTVDFSGAATAGDLSVTATNACGTSAARTISITVGVAPANIAVLVTATSAVTSNTTGSIVQLNPLIANQSPASIYSISGTGSNAMRFSGSASSTGYLTNSNDGSLLSWTGVNNTNTTANANTLNPRAVGTLDVSNTFNLATTYTGNSGNQARSATSVDNSTWFISDQGGLYTNGTAVPSPVANIRGIKSFDGIVYVAQASTTVTAIQVSTVSASTGGTITGLPGLTNNSAIQDFYLISSGSNGTSFDVLYTVSATVATTGTIAKYSLSAGTWIANGTYTTTFGGFGLAAKVAGSGAELYVSTGNGATTNNSVIKLTDVAGYNTPIAITTLNNVTLYTTTGNSIIKGVAFAPITPVCNAPVVTSITSNTPICAGSSLSLGAAATGTAPLTYAWTGAGTFSSTSVANPTVTNATSGTYSVTVTNGCGSSTSSTSVVVNSLPTAIITPDGPVTFCTGGSVTLSASTGTSYLWSDLSTGQTVSVNASGTYTVIVTSNNCSATSSPVTVTVNPLVTPSVSISANPGNIICSVTSVTFTATPVNGGSLPSYQWKLNGVNVGTNSDTYSNSGLVNNDAITCEMTSNDACASPTFAISNSIAIIVTTSVTPAVSIAANPGTTICSGTNVTFTAMPTNGGATPAYQWILNGNNVGSNSDTYTNNSLANNDVVSCIMTSSNGCASPTTATSNNLNITVTTLVAPSVSIAALPGSTICVGTSVTFLATLSNASVASYQWTVNGVNAGTNAAFTSSSLVNNDLVVCTITTTAGCVTTNTAVSNTITMVVNVVPTPTISGTLSFCSGGSTTLDAGGSFASYLWSTNETSQTISVNTNGTYTVTVSDGTCTGTSSPVAVTELITPNQPANFTTSSASVFSGQSGVVYTVTNDPTATYVWSYSGTGATINGSSNSVTVNFSGAATSGIISVSAINNCGTSAARTIAVTVTAMPGTMRITEYMYGGLGTGGEFVEFTNVGTTTVDMTGWSFDDNSRIAGSQSLTAFGIVQPGESVILSESNAGAFRTNWNLCAGVKVIGGSTNNLSREDEINLYDASSVLVDRLTYGDQTYAPGSIRTSGVSGWVNNAGLGANTILQWTLSVVADVENSYASSQAEIGSPGKSKRATVVFDPCFVNNGAPTIIVDVTATTNYLDGGVLVSPPTPYGISGVINDATDPASTLGIDFTINDDVTPVASLIVTVASSNLTVVPNANVILTGSGASRNVKITPAAVGYSNITVTVNDGTNSTSYIINYAASDPSPVIIPANTFWHTGMSDGSNAIAIDNSYYISGDDELNVLNVYSRSQSGLPFVSYNYTANLNLPNPGSPEVDVEAATRSTGIANRVYWTGSMSNGKLPYDNKPNRDRLFATNVSGTGAGTTFSFAGYVNIRTALLAWGDANGYAFSASAAAGVDSKGVGGFSLEGMVFGPDNTTMFLGLRAPLVPTSFRTNAVIAPIVNFEAWFNNGAPAGNPTFGTPIELNLGMRGIRDIIRLSNGTYIIVAGSPLDNGGVNNIYKWSGYASDAPIAISNTAGGILNIEGLMQVNDSTGGTLSLSKLQIITDGGAEILYQDNSEAKDFGDLNLRKFRSDVITGLDLNICTDFLAAISATDTVKLCGGSAVTLAANTGSNLNYLWSTSATTSSISATNLQNYSVTVTSSTSGCSKVSNVVTVANAMPSDFNFDGVTNVNDFLMLLGLYNQFCTCPEDLDKDGVVNVNDFLILLGKYNQTCSQGALGN